MCNFNILIKKEKIKEDNLKNLTGFLMAVTSYSYMNNADGDGIYFNNPNLLIKSRDKLNLTNFEKEIKKSNFIISHQRLATSGLTSKYIQPFFSDEFVFGHNGILSEYVKGNHSDTFRFFIKFLKKFNKITENSREKRIVKTIKDMLKNTYGSYSMVLFDKVTKNLYYFKNCRTDIYFHKNTELLYITTSRFNDIFLKLFPNEEFNTEEIEDDIIYRITKKLQIKPVGKIEEEKVKFTYVYEEKKSRKQRKRDKRKRKKQNQNLSFYDIGKSKGFKEVIISEEHIPCFYCGRKTNRFSQEDLNYVCDCCNNSEYPTYV